MGSVGFIKQGDAISGARLRSDLNLASPPPFNLIRV